MPLITDFADEFRRYRILGERAMSQIPDEALNRIAAAEGNSIAMIVRHMSGNLVSRFTNFLTEDGEKAWRERDEEFATREYTRAEVDSMWARGWDALEKELAALTDAHLEQTVHIRKQPLTVHAALSRSVAHAGYHVGQIVLLARMTANSEWKWLSIPKNQSAVYNQNPTLEKKPQ